MLDLGDAATHKASLAKEKEEDEVLMTIETPPSDTVSTIPASGRQEEKVLSLRWRQWRMKSIAVRK